MVSKEEQAWAKSFSKNDEVKVFITSKEGVVGKVKSVKKKRKILGESYEIVVRYEDGYEETIYWQEGRGKDLIKKLDEPKKHNFF